ncbi:Thiosulfate sulfurtransferase GlpE [Candidatus Izimaplasma bacterium HR1]|jgi:rhodanese-related sulfurtransferase|uniref:rhodanese-like domain-containing protein n=1 Tax=Candidatus Izimoplasma sp. HR1 TaxID=1541959 RepID=UPI0004F6C67B|nr:Thiosulfate sulfurtransferase GlpE [Candidatus Izimaplasma bacterium HR1]
MIQIQDGIKHIFPKDFIKIHKDSTINIIDIREPFELLDLPFENAINIPMNALLTKYNSLLKKDESYYILCHHGQRSYLVTEVLTKKGYDVINIVGGVDLVNRFDSVTK